MRRLGLDLHSAMKPTASPLARAVFHYDKKKHVSCTYSKWKIHNVLTSSVPSTEIWCLAWCWLESSFLFIIFPHGRLKASPTLPTHPDFCYRNIVRLWSNSLHWQHNRSVINTKQISSSDIWLGPGGFGEQLKTCSIGKGKYAYLTFQAYSCLTPLCVSYTFDG